MSVDLGLLKENTVFDYNAITARVAKDMAYILDILKIPYENIKDYLQIKGTNMVDILGLLYTNPMDMMYGNRNIPTINVSIDHPDATKPRKARESDVGYDLSIVKIHKHINKNTIMYDTGIKVQIPWGYYIEVMPRSSLSKTGWILANSVGIIDSSYTGNIYVVLTRTIDETDLLQLPFKGFQLIIRKQYHANMRLSSSNPDETLRGSGGFGSTN